MIDLHTHSTASDGSLTPRELARLGKSAGLHVMALTDHDGTGGVDDFLDEAQKIGLIGIPGIEFSAEVPHGQLHLVGLNFNPHDPALNAKLERVLNSRADRNLEILKAFNEAGIDFTFEEVAAFSGDKLISRVHFAQALLKRGHVNSIPEAFERYVGKGALCYRNRFRYYPHECIEMIHAAGGLLFMAHPLSLDLPDFPSLERAIADLRDQGLDGMECYYSTYDTETTVALLRIAKRLNLVPSVASDFHGAPKPTIHLGQLHPAPETEAALRAALHI